ncbi:MAG: hypothetical protein OXT67_02480, partial [Zetaproteobacteria bacterium]|nr:hypothetical protein [Zetaproteobacteria bacterium]
MAVQKINKAQLSTILSYWNTHEFLTPYDLSGELKDIKSHQQTEPLSILKAQLLTDLKPGFFDFDRFNFTIFFGVTDMSAVIDKLGSLNHAECFRSDRNRLTCVGKVEFTQECGVTKVDMVGISSLHWAITELIDKNQVPSSSDFRDYGAKIKAHFEQMTKHFRKIHPKNITTQELHKITYRFLHDKKVWYPDDHDYQILCIRQKKSKPYIQTVLCQTFSMQQAQAEALSGPIAEKVGKYLLSSHEEEKQEIVKFIRSNISKYDGDINTVVDMIIRKIFSIKRFDILNSFYIDDLQIALNAVEKGKNLPLLEHFLNVQSTSSNLLDKSSRNRLIESTSPAKTPHGRWATNPSFAMSLMQQYAINQCVNLESGELYSVNGPPGTGKTTLIKDVIADICVKRAKVLSRLSDPLDAFHQTCLNNTSDSHYIYPLRSELKGFEVIVASSNNKAVENISKDLYLHEAIDPEYHDLFTFLPEVTYNFSAHETPSSSKWG